MADFFMFLFLGLILLPIFYGIYLILRILKKFGDKL